MDQSKKECSYDFAFKLIANNADKRWKKEMYYFPEGERAHR